MVMLMDSSKIDKDLTFTFASLEDIDFWVCDQDPDKEIIDKCREFKVELI